MSAMQRGQLVALASPALRPVSRPCWPNRPAVTWLLVAALHLAFWLGISLQDLLPVLASIGLKVEGDPPAQYADLLSLLREVFTLSCVDTANLQLATSAAINKELTCTFPTPLVERVRGDLPWHHIWPRLEGPSLRAVEVNIHPAWPPRFPGTSDRQTDTSGEWIPHLHARPASLCSLAPASLLGHHNP